MKKKKDKTMNCKTTQKEVAAAAGGTLGEEVRRHLERCDPCRAFAEHCRTLAEHGRTVREDEPDFNGTDAVRLARLAKARVNEERAPTGAGNVPRWAMPALSASLSTAAVIVVVGLGLAKPAKPGPRASVTAVSPRTTEPTRATPGRPTQPVHPLGTPQRPSLWTAGSLDSVKTALPADLAALSRYLTVSSPAGKPAAGSVREDKIKTVPDAGTDTNKDTNKGKGTGTVPGRPGGPRQIKEVKP